MEEDLSVQVCANLTGEFERMVKLTLTPTPGTAKSKLLSPSPSPFLLTSTLFLLLHPLSSFSPPPPLSPPLLLPPPPPFPPSPPPSTYNSLSHSLSPLLLFLISHISTSSLLSSLPGTSDYVSTPVLITFHPESSLQVACSSISINNDFVLELQPETFTVRLSSPSPSIIITGQPSATISIWDDDSKEHQGL